MASTKLKLELLESGKSEPVHRGRQIEDPYRLRQCHVTQSTATSSREHQGLANDAGRVSQNSKRRVGEGYAVRPVGLHPVRWNGPHAALKVELFPSGAPGLYGAGGGQDEELQAAGRAVGLRSKTRHQRRKFLPSSRRQSSSFNRRIDPSSRAGVSESADRIAPRNVFASTFSWKEAPCGFRRRSRDPSWAGILKRDGPLAPESPTGHRILPVCDFIQESGQWMRNLQKSDRGGVYGIVERDSGVATVECDSHTNGGSSGSSGRMSRSFRRSSSIFASRA